MFPTEYIPFTIEQREKAAATDLEEFLRRRGEKLLPAGRDISFVMRCYGLDYPQAVSLLLDAGASPAMGTCTAPVPWALLSGWTFQAVTAGTAFTIQEPID